MFVRKQSNHIPCNSRLMSRHATSERPPGSSHDLLDRRVVRDPLQLYPHAIPTRYRGQPLSHPCTTAVVLLRSTLAAQSHVECCMYALPSTAPHTHLVEQQDFTTSFRSTPHVVSEWE